MTTRVTVSLDKKLAEHARQFALKRGTSLSELISESLAQLIAKQALKSVAAPSAALKAIMELEPIDLPADFDYKQALYEAASK